MAEYREQLYAEIVRRKKDTRRRHKASERRPHYHRSSAAAADPYAGHGSGDGGYHGRY